MTLPGFRTTLVARVLMPIPVCLLSSGENILFDGTWFMVTQLACVYLSFHTYGMSHPQPHIVHILTGRARCSSGVTTAYDALGPAV